MSQWQPQACTYLLAKDYPQAIAIYEQIINHEPEVVTHYFYLGLLQLLNGQEEEAQFSWVGVADQDPEQIDVSELVAILSTEVQRQQEISDYETASLICQHIHAIAPSNLDNLLTLVWLSWQLQTFNPDHPTFRELIKNLAIAGRSEPQPLFNHDLLWQVLASLLQLPYRLLAEFTAVCLPFVQEPRIFVKNLIKASTQFAYEQQRDQLAIDLLELCLRLLPQDLEVLEYLCRIHLKLGSHTKGLEAARLYSQLSESLVDKVFANTLLLGILLESGNWQEAMAVFTIQESLLTALIAENPIPLPQSILNRLYVANYFTPYIRDKPERNRALQNQIGQLCQAHTQVDLVVSRQKQKFGDRPLKIGYISRCMASHSVGWLARWLMQYHDHTQFQIYGYFLDYRPYPDGLQSWYERQMDQVYQVGLDGDCEAIAHRIAQDQIDILIDLDSSTFDITCAVMARKPAPIQVTWLGADASGIPVIDYFIADPYVLPDSAQAYYAEKIWRLPQTYIAVNGFEVGIPTLRRDRLDIPTDAVVYLSAQTALKRHPDTVRLQMQIIKSVPNSYFLIKGLGDQDAIQDFFREMAIAEGVNPDRLRFLAMTATESIHRANLAIADVVLDTYPYNGATTTLETLWMCIPLVAKAGQQFAARNSYTMMINAGISEGIAWSDTEYVEWGIRLGQDAALREDIAARLKASRQTAPLWNAQQFTHDLEKAYQQMWQNYLQEYA